MKDRHGEMEVLMRQNGECDHFSTFGLLILECIRKVFIAWSLIARNAAAGLYQAILLKWHDLISAARNLKKSVPD